MLRRIPMALIRFYQKHISPHFPPVCRFRPSCSQYALEAIERYGIIRGGWLGFFRICRCNPWSKGGWDPVPLKFEIFGRHRIPVPDPRDSAQYRARVMGLLLQPRTRYVCGRNTRGFSYRR